MAMHRSFCPRRRRLLAIGSMIVSVHAFATQRAAAQGTRGSIELHANGNVDASSIGLPAFPKARLYSDSTDSAADLGLTFGDFHFRLLLSQYLTSASPTQVLDFYRKPLARYGEVLECVNGAPVGSLSATSSGLTCSDEDGKGSHVHVGNTSHELRAGTRERFRVVAIDSPRSDSTRFDLLYMEVPKGKGADGH